MANILETFTYEVEDKEGRIVKVSAKIEKENEYYYWDVNYLTKPRDLPAIGYYFAMKTASSISEARREIDSYIKMMKRSKVLKYNENY